MTSFKLLRDPRVVYAISFLRQEISKTQNLLETSKQISACIYQRQSSTKPSPFSSLTETDYHNLFLLQFLYTKKTVAKAKQALQDFCSFREGVLGIAPTSTFQELVKLLQPVLETGFVLAPPGHKDSFERPIVMVWSRKVFPKLIPPILLTKSLWFVLEQMLYDLSLNFLLRFGTISVNELNEEASSNTTHEVDPNHQSLLKNVPPGICILNDASQCTLENCSSEMGKLLIDSVTHRFPLRIGIFYIIHPPKLFTLLWSSGLKYLTKPKVRDRIVVLMGGSESRTDDLCLNDTLISEIGKERLTQQFGGDVVYTNEQWINELLSL